MSLFILALLFHQPVLSKNPHACLDEFRASVRFNLLFYVQHRELKGRTRDVPRLRGEKRVKLHLLCLFTGSPPLTRGKARLLDTLCHWAGITPAYAGKRLQVCRLNHLSKDHPRLRGEKEARATHTFRALGSPPLTRGKVLQDERVFSFRRITPAYAGKSGLGLYIYSGEEDHPRLRGEKT